MTSLKSWSLALAAACLCGAALAQSADEAVPELPAPARLAVVEGTAHFWRPGDGQWSSAQVNTALVAGDALATGDRSNIEVQVGSRDFVRMMADSQLVVSRRDVGNWRFRVPVGNVSFDLRGLAAGQRVEIEAPNTLFVAERSGYYRIDVRAGATAMTVRHGGYASLPALGRGVGSEEVAVVRDDRPSVIEVSRAGAADSWDRWNDSRSDYYARAASYRYLPQDVYGAAELDQYGSWRETSDYGPVWLPSVAGGWTPFSRGSWRWDPVYEWTWVDEAPWGWTTAHHGRWVLIDGYWAWAPGPRAARTTYLPATVVFYGTDGNIAYGVSPLTAGVSWVALGWGEPVLPWWGHRDYRGRPWWGGWHGPRVVNRVVVERHERIDPGHIRFSHRDTYMRRAPDRRDDYRPDRRDDYRPDRRDDYRPDRRDHVPGPDLRSRPTRPPEAAAEPKGFEAHRNAPPVVVPPPSRGEVDDKPYDDSSQYVRRPVKEPARPAMSQPAPVVVPQEYRRRADSPQPAAPAPQGRFHPDESQAQRAVSPPRAVPSMPVERREAQPAPRNADEGGRAARKDGRRPNDDDGRGDGRGNRR